MKLSGVKSVNFRDKSTLDDSSDDRDSNIYKISRHLKFDSKSFQGAWGMKEIPFGIEYVKNVDILELNLGLSSAVNANKVIINQHEDVPYHGFVTCKQCGKSSSKFNQKDYKFHYGYCKHKDREYNGIKDDVFEEVYLLREIKTEALKVLLPVQEFESDATVNMFKAGLELGLKKYYKGNPQHLSIINYSEYNAKNSRFDKYLVLYDNIPGGTGYLEKLFSPADFTMVISKAYEAIRDCSCKAKGKDGCYRCIYTYSNQFIQDELSRERAELLFKKIVDKSDAWETYTTGLGALTSNGQIEESELEDRFIRSLRNYLQSQNPQGFKFEDFIENGIVNYKFKITSGDYAFYYVIRPQYELGPTNGVKYNTRSDFFISISSIEKDGVSIEDDDVIESVKGIAIYLDGYTFHATEENCRFFDDLKKRVAIAESNSIISWSLTWSDIEKFDAIEKENDSQSKEFKRDYLFVDKVKYRNCIDSFKQILGNGFINDALFACKNTFERLLWLLSNPLETKARHKKIGLLLALFQQQFGTPSTDSSAVDEILSDPLKIIDNSLMATDRANGNFYVLPEISIHADFATIKVAVKISDISVKSSIAVSNIPGTLDKVTWERFWQLYNLIQENCMSTDK